MPSGVFQIELKESFRSLHQIRRGALSRISSSKASSQEIGSETASQAIAQVTCPAGADWSVRRAPFVRRRLALGFPFGHRAADTRNSLFGKEPDFPRIRIITRIRIMSTVVAPTFRSPARTSPGGRPASIVPFGSSLNRSMLPLNFVCNA